MKVVRARHVSWAGSIPVVKQMFDLQCINSPPAVPGARHFGTTPSGLPWARYPWACCDCFCTDAEESSDLCWVKPGCAPWSEGPGIMRRVCCYVGEIANCISARNHKTVLEYDDDEEAWLGSVELRGGTLTLRWECTAEATEFDPPAFKLTTGGCMTTAEWVYPLTCDDPLAVTYQVSFTYACCGCGTGVFGTPTTNVAPEIGVYIRANCRKKVWGGRHVGQTAGGGLLPVIALESPCDWHHTGYCACESMQCPLQFEILADGTSEPCQGAVGTYYLSYVFGAGWELQGPGPEEVHAWNVTCVDLGWDADARDFLMRLDVLVACLADNQGGGSTDPFPCSELENLSQEFDVAMTWTGEGSSQCCVGTYRVRITRLGAGGGMMMAMRGGGGPGPRVATPVAVRTVQPTEPAQSTMRGRCVHADLDTLLKNVCGQPKGGVKCTYACDHPDESIRASHPGCIPLRQWQPESSGGCPHWSDTLTTEAE